MEMTDREELRQDAETGRRYKIAMEVWREFLDNHKEELVREMESKNLDPWEAQDIAVQLAIMRKFRDTSYRNIQIGEIAEERLSKDGE